MACIGRQRFLPGRVTLSNETVPTMHVAVRSPDCVIPDVAGADAIDKQASHGALLPRQLLIWSEFGPTHTALKPYHKVRLPSASYSSRPVNI